MTSQPQVRSGIENQDISGLENLNFTNEITILDVGKSYYEGGRCGTFCGYYGDSKTDFDQVLDENFQKIYTLTEKNDVCVCNICVFNNSSSIILKGNNQDSNEVIRMENPRLYCCGKIQVGSK